jgi:hypothetical protein
MDYGRPARAVLASVDALLDTGSPLSDRLNLQYGLGWRNGSFSTVHSKVGEKPMLKEHTRNKEESSPRNDDEGNIRVEISVWKQV